MLQGNTPLELDPADRKMLAYARKLTAKPWTVKDSDIAGLRSVGFSDKAILQINLVTDYFNFVNRLASGLGVSLESYWEKEENG